MLTQQIHKIGDSRELLKDVSGINLVITSPPYNVGKEYEKLLSLADYEKMLTEVYTACYNSMSTNSRICVNVPYHMAQRDTIGIFNPYIINYSALIKSGFKYRHTVTWNQFNSESDTGWGSFRSPSAPWIRSQTETIIVMHKGEWKLGRDGESDITPDEFVRWTLDSWNINPVTHDIGENPSPFPEELPIRCIKLFSYVGDWILDPFLGGGTTLRACRLTNRNGIGIELSPKYESQIINKAMINQPQIKDLSVRNLTEV